MYPFEIGLYLFITVAWSGIYGFLRSLMRRIKASCPDPEVAERARWKMWMMGLEAESEEELLKACSNPILVERYFRWFGAYKLCVFLFGVIGLLSWVLFRLEAASL